MIHIQKLKDIKGKYYLPTNPDLFLLSAICATLNEKSIKVSYIHETPLIKIYCQWLSSFAKCTFNDDHTAFIKPLKEKCLFVELQYDIVPFRDTILFMLLAQGITVAFDRIPPKRFEVWKRISASLGCTLYQKEFKSSDQTIYGISVDPATQFSIPDKSDNPDFFQVLLAISISLQKKCLIAINFPFQSPLRFLIPALGYDLLVKSTAKQKYIDPIARRIRLMSSKTKKKKSHGYSYSVSINYESLKQETSYEIKIPGDDILFSMLVVAKSLVQKGNFIIENVPLESWSTLILQYIRKMGCPIGIQTSDKTAFGNSGMVSFQKFKLVGRKNDCRPLFLFTRYLPALMVLANYSPNQSIFRDLDDLRNEEPDAIEQLLATIRLMGGRHGEMPDGMVIDGTKFFDGFDHTEPINPAIDGALAIAGLVCNGATAINDENILMRWPNFNNILDSLSTKRN